MPAIEIAAALARLAQGDKALLLEKPAKPERREFSNDERPARKPFAERESKSRGSAGKDERRRERFADRGEHATPFATSTERHDAPASATFNARRDGDKLPRKSREEAPKREPRQERAPEYGMETFRIEVGHVHGVKPNNIVGAIANEAGLESKHIGRIDIRDDFSLIDLPEGMPPELLAHLKKVWVAGQRLRISRDTGHSGDGTHAPKRASHTKDKPAKKKKRF